MFLDLPQPKYTLLLVLIPSPVSSPASACLLVFSVQLGVQTLPMLLSGELFPSEVRAFCKGLTRSFACVCLVISLKAFPVFEEKLELYGTFYLFSGVLLVGLPLVFWSVPETKDLGLESIQYYFTEPKTIFYIELNDITMPGDDQKKKDSPTN